MKHKIYVASSWRNVYYPDVVAKLRKTGHEVYDFRNPPSGTWDLSGGMWILALWNGRLRNIEII